MTDLAYQYLAGAVLAAVEGLGLVGILLHIYLQIRRTPREVLQLRLFQQVDTLGRGLVALAIGIAGGVLLMLPIILHIDVPAVLSVAAGIPFFLLFVYGLVALLRGFRFPTRRVA